MRNGSVAPQCGGQPVTDVQAAEAPADTAAPEVDDSPDAVFSRVAAQMGHSPKDKWRGDPEKWVDPLTFILNTPKVMKGAKDQLEKSARAAAAAMDKVRSDAIADAEARIAAAAEAGDKEGAAVATADLKRASAKPDAAVTDFAARNAWYNTDPAATSVAIAAAQKVADSNGSVAAQLVAAEKEVRKRFPELFEDQAVEEDEPQVRNPPAVHGGQRVASTAPRKKGFSDLPKDVQRAMTPKLLKSFGLSETEYAESYFKENA